MAHCNHSSKGVTITYCTRPNCNRYHFDSKSGTFCFECSYRSLITGQPFQALPNTTSIHQFWGGLNFLVMTDENAKVILICFSCDRITGNNQPMIEDFCKRHLQKF